jgi:N utilization substance protein B
MLNRRTLRIKAMQTLFAYQHAKISNFNIALEKIGGIFGSKLETIENQDPIKLKHQKEEASKLFGENYKILNGKVTGSADNEVNKVTEDVIKEYHQQLKKDFTYTRNLMLEQVEEIPKTYYAILYLLSELSDFSIQSKHKEHSLVKNLLICKIKEDNSLQSLILKLQISWDTYRDQIIIWYRAIKKSSKYKEYSSKEEHGFDEDKDLVTFIVREVIFKDEVSKEFWEEYDINWAENKAIVKSMVSKSLKETKEEGDLVITEISYNWEEDKTFFDLLFTISVEEDSKFEEVIVQKLKNWDIERVAITDKAILLMAMTEFINFPSIPVKVTINEYIEISKKYSTPKSKQFVNGILDVLAKDLEAQGLIKKSGRGLIDNK